MIDLDEYHTTDETQYVETLYLLLHRYANETRRVLGTSASGDATKFDKSYEDLRNAQWSIINKPLESTTFLFYQDEGNFGVVHIGSFAELKLVLLRSMGEAIKISACTGW